MRVFPIKGASMADLGRDLEFNLNRHDVQPENIVELSHLPHLLTGTAYPYHALLITNLPGDPELMRTA